MFRFLCIHFTRSQIMYFDEFFANFGDVNTEAMTTSSHSRNLSEAYSDWYSTLYSSPYNVCLVSHTSYMCVISCLE